MLIYFSDQFSIPSSHNQFTPPPLHVIDNVHYCPQPLNIQGNPNQQLFKLFLFTVHLTIRLGI